MGYVDKDGMRLHGDVVAQIVRLTGGAVDQTAVGQLLANVTQCPSGSLSPAAAARFIEGVIEPLRNVRVALLVVDFQNDFVGGSLAIKNGDAGQDPDEAVAPLNGLLQDKNIDAVVYTMDWHPHNHISFYEHCRNSDRKLSAEDRGRKLRPFDTVQFDEPNCTQVLYPTHCVQGSWGADLDPRIVVVPGSHTVQKGTDVLVDSYSAFFDNAKLSKTSLEDILRKEHITAVVACGLAYDICVAATLKDASDLGFLSAVVTDCTKGLSTEGIELANEAFGKKQIAVLNSEQAYGLLNRSAIPFEWVQKLAMDIRFD